MKYYRLYIRTTHGDKQEVRVRSVKVSDQWDLFAYIGYLYSTCLEKIDRIDYEETNQAVYNRDSQDGYTLRNVSSLYRNSGAQTLVYKEPAPMPSVKPAKIEANKE